MSRNYRVIEMTNAFSIRLENAFLVVGDALTSEGAEKISGFPDWEVTVRLDCRPGIDR